jgi:leucyl aminopeptidase
MPVTLKIGFAGFERPRGVLIVFCAEGLKFGAKTQRLLSPIGDLFRRAASADRFTAKNGTILDILAPAGLNLPRLVVIGTGKERDLKDRDLVKLGGTAMGALRKGAPQATIVAEFASGTLKGEQIADLALGARLRGYTFDQYKTKKKEGDDRATSVEVNFACANASGAEKAWARRSGLAEGVVLARDLVNEPANVLYPAEFARRASALRKLGVVVEVLDTPAMKKLGMNALLGVAQGSAHEPKVVVMRWNGGKRELRLRRHFDQTGARHGGHEGRHGRRGLCGRADALARFSESQSQRRRRHRLGREHAGR